MVFSGFVNGETASVLGGTLSYGGAAQGATNVGNYALTASGLSSGNYAISYTAGSLAVSPAALTVAANNAGKIYDGLAYGGGNGCVQRFRQRRDRVGAGRHAELWRCGAGCDQRRQLRADGVGPELGQLRDQLHGRLARGQPGGADGCRQQCRKIYDGLAYGGGNGVVFSGFVNGETASVLGGTLSYGGAAQGATNAGNYALTASGLSSGNYAISYTAGSLGSARPR